MFQTLFSGTHFDLKLQLIVAISRENVKTTEKNVNFRLIAGGLKYSSSLRNTLYILYQQQMESHAYHFIVCRPFCSDICSSVKYVCVHPAL